jgi:Sec-independent protein translocase protein TatA
MSSHGELIVLVLFVVPLLFVKRLPEIVRSFSRGLHDQRESVDEPASSAGPSTTHS